MSTAPRSHALRAWLHLFLILGLGATLASAARAQDGPRRGGVLDWYDVADPGRLDAHLESANAVLQATAGVFNGLLRVDPGEPTGMEPDLALRWDVAADGRRYTFHLRPGVRWHDGQPFTSADVTATLERVLDPKVRSPRCGAMLRPLVAGVEAPDPATVVLRLRFPTGALLASLASAWCRVVPRHILQRHGDLNRPEAQVGTGPFRFARYERGSLIEWERNPDYFRPGRPYLDGVRQFVIPSLPRQLAAAKVGQVMLSGGNLGMTRTQADELRRARPEAELYLWPLNTLSALHLNAARGPFREKDLRRAAFLAVDRLALFRKVQEGDGVPCAILDPKLFGAFALPLAEVQALPGCRPARAEDLEEARRLVARHHPQGVDVDVVIRAFGTYADRAQLVIEDLRRVGIRGRLRVLESAAGFLAFERGEFDMIGGQDTGMVTTDPAGVFAVLFTSQAGRNWEGWSDATVDRLADEALRTAEPERRRELYHALQRRLLTVDTGAIPLGWMDGWYFRDPRVRGYRPTLSIYDGNAFEDVWLAR